MDADLVRPPGFRPELDQRATVLVDGVAVGTWFVAGSNYNHAWREEDFLLPSAVTLGRSRVAVEIQFVSAADDWTEFQYQTHSIVP